MEFSEELGLGNVQFEGNAQILIHAINKYEECWSWYEHLVDQECKTNLEEQI